MYVESAVVFSDQLSSLTTAEIHLQHSFLQNIDGRDRFSLAVHLLNLDGAE